MILAKQFAGQTDGCEKRCAERQSKHWHDSRSGGKRCGTRAAALEASGVASLHNSPDHDGWRPAPCVTLESYLATCILQGFLKLFFRISG